MHFLIFSGGNFTPSSFTKKAIQEADVIIAADHGADIAVNSGIYPSAVIGDLDSISNKTKKVLNKQVFKYTNTTLLAIPKGQSGPRNESEKDQTDTELAITYAVEHGATKVTILAGLAGDRFDHIMGNLLAATLYTIPVFFVQENQISWVAKGPTKQKIAGKKGDILSLIPLSSVEKITTENLYYPLNNGELIFGKPRGISNVLTNTSATVSFEKGTLLFVHTIRDEAE